MSIEFKEYKATWFKFKPGYDDYPIWYVRSTIISSNCFFQEMIDIDNLGQCSHYMWHQSPFICRCINR